MGKTESPPFVTRDASVAKISEQGNDSVYAFHHLQSVHYFVIFVTNFTPMRQRKQPQTEVERAKQ